MIDQYVLIIFLLIFWYIDRLREIAAWPWWRSKWGEWFDTYYTPKRSTLNPFRDAYHTFKFVANCIVVGIVTYHYGWEMGLCAIGAWGVGQYLGLMSKEEI